MNRRIRGLVEVIEETERMTDSDGKWTVEEKTTNIRGEATTRKQQFNSAAVPLLLTSIDFMTVARLLDAPHVEFLLGKRHEGVSRRRDDSIIVNTLGSAVVAPRPR